MKENLTNLTYTLVAIIRKRLGIEAELYTTLQIPSPFKKTPLLQLLSHP